MAMNGTAVALVDVVDRGHVRMGQSGRSARLAQEPFAAVVVVERVAGEELHGDVARKLRVAGAPYRRPFPP